MALDLTIIGRSDQGQVRPRNEDAFRIRSDAGLAVVADGMGGHPAGAEASALAVETFFREVLGHSPPSSNGAWGERMLEGVESAHRRLMEEGHLNPARRGMGTTLTALHVSPDTGVATLVHVGDSRAYRLREGSLTRLSRDHTWVQEQVDAGNLRPGVARVHPMAHVLTRVVGGSEDLPEPQLRHEQTDVGDLYLLCTDGLTTHLTDDTIREILMASPDSPEKVATSLVQAANEGGGTDNVTVVLVAAGAPGAGRAQEPAGPG